MRNPNFQRRLSPTRPFAPTVPSDLRARCLATIPHSVRHSVFSHAPVVPKKTRIQRPSFGGVFLCAALVASAFWSTRPINDSGTTISASAAFAQTVRAMQNISGAHCFGKRLADGKGWHTSQWSLWEGWFDAQRGAYALRWSEQLPSDTAASTLSNRFNVFRALYLPNGQIYERTGNQLMARSDISSWRRTQKEVAALALGGAVGKSSELRTYGATPKLICQQQVKWKVQWHGQETTLFLFLQIPYDKQSPTIRTKIYVDPKTNLVIGKQDFALFKGGTSRLVSEISIEYTNPAVSLFDVFPLKQGVKTIKQLPTHR